MMSMDQHFSRPTAADVDRSSVIGSVWSGVGLWLRACADYYAAAADYEDLARLSDAELARRGLSRDTLARDVCSRCERGERP